MERQIAVYRFIVDALFVSTQPSFRPVYPDGATTGQATTGVEAHCSRSHYRLRPISSDGATIDRVVLPLEQVQRRATRRLLVRG